MKSKNLVYMDNAATTRQYDEVIDLISDVSKTIYGNPSSLHQLGIDAQDHVDKSREVVAKSINAKPSEIIFTSGGTESNNLAIEGIANYCKTGKIITSTIEHPSVKNVFKFLEKKGFEISYINVDEFGFLNLEELENEVDDKTVLVSIIHANNEIGTIQDMKKIVEIVKSKNSKVKVHFDACQSLTKTDIDVVDMNVDLLSLNSHKLHGPKGVGALFVKSGVKLKKQYYGGHQEFDLRSGTENISGILGFAKALQLGMESKQENIAHMLNLQEKLAEGLLKIPHSSLNGPAFDKDKRLCNNLNITFNYVEGEGLLMILDQAGICVSTGSACSSKTLSASHVILALGKNHEHAHGTIRFSLSKFNTLEEVGYVIEKVGAAVSILRKLSPLTPKELQN
jgi:cysteine desulfurase